MPHKVSPAVEAYIKSLNQPSSPKGATASKRKSLWARTVGNLRRCWPLRLMFAAAIASVILPSGCTAAAPHGESATTAPTASTVDVAAVRQIQSGIRSLATDLANLRLDIASVQAAQQADDGSMTSIDARIDDLSSSFEKLMGQVNAVDELTQSLLVRTATISDGQTAVVAGISDIRSQVDVLSQSTTALAKELELARSTVIQNSKTLTDHFNDATQEMINAVAQSKGSLQSDLGATRDELNTLHATVNHLQTTTSSIATRLKWITIGFAAASSVALFLLAKKRRDIPTTKEVVATPAMKTAPPIAETPPLPSVPSTLTNALVGVSTHQGLVRNKNDDCGRHLVVGPYRSLVVADGMGGLRFGAEASQAVVQGAVRHLSQALKFCCESDSPLDLKSMAWNAVVAGQNALEALVTSQPELSVGCRTTLIVTILDTRTGELAHANIGDGGGFRHSATGSTDHFVKPMKEPGSSALRASLGPKADGSPHVGSLTVFPGDLILVGTDGILDFNEDLNDFSCVKATDLAAIVRSATADTGDIEAALGQVVEGYVTYLDPVKKTPVIDDNATIAALLVPAKAA